MCRTGQIAAGDPTQPVSDMCQIAFMRANENVRLDARTCLQVWNLSRATQLIPLSRLLCVIGRADGKTGGRKKHPKLEDVQDFIKIQERKKKHCAGRDNGAFCVLSRFPEWLLLRV